MGTVFATQGLVDGCASESWAVQTTLPSRPSSGHGRLPEFEESSVCHWNKMFLLRVGTSTRAFTMESKLSHLVPGIVMVSDGTVNFIINLMPS